MPQILQDLQGLQGLQGLQARWLKQANETVRKKAALMTCIRAAFR